MSVWTKKFTVQSVERGVSSMDNEVQGVRCENVACVDRKVESVKHTVYSI